MITQDLKMVTTAASGIAATLFSDLTRLPNHRFKLPITPSQGLSCATFKKESNKGKFFSLIFHFGIIDEGPMLNKLCLETLDQSMKDLVPAQDRDKKNFGGMLGKW